MSARRRSADEPVTLEQLLAAKEIVVFCGSGGVGKTSVAAAAALRRDRAPRRQGARAHDRPGPPARDRARPRGLGNRAHRVAPEVLKAAGIEPRGRALGRDARHQAVVGRPRAAGTRPTRRPRTGILENRLYTNLTARFVQSHDYIAMERLFEIHATGEYDLIVIDTPPTRNAIDFLDAPARMADFFGSRLLRWLTLPYRVGGKRGTRIINVASRPFYQMADRILGSQFLQDIAEFFLNFQSMYDGFVTRAHGGRTAAARQAHDVRGRDDARGRAAARGRALLRDCSSSATSISARSCSTRRCPTRCATRRARRPRPRASTTPGPLADALARDGRSRARRSRPHGPCAANDRGVVPQLLGGRDARGRAAGRARAASPTSSPAIPTFSDDISDVDGLDAIGRYLFSGPAREHARRSRARPHGARRARSRAHGAPRLLVAPLADLSFADLMLLAPITGEEGHRFVVLAQVRPVTGQTNYPQDLVGTVVDEVERPLYALLLAIGRHRPGRHRRARFRRIASGCR